MYVCKVPTIRYNRRICILHRGLFRLNHEDMFRMESLRDPANPTVYNRIVVYNHKVSILDLVVLYDYYTVTHLKIKRGNY